MNFTDNIFNKDILNSISDGIFTIDKEFRITFFNKSAEEITGIPKEEAIGKFCKNIFRTEYCDNNCPIIKALNTNTNVQDFDTEFLTKSNNPIPIKLNASVLRNENGVPIGGVVSFRKKYDFVQLKDHLIKNSHFYGIVGMSKQMNDIFNLIIEIADCDAAVLIQGETGTGKELIADAIQITSKRRNRPFIKVNCSVIPENLLASELFGHIKGAFTDAIKDRIGRFELADGGTIFLDEIGEISLQNQVKLLRIIQQGTFEKLGDSVTKKVDVRIIAATNMNLENAIAEGKFRQDLYYRLNVIPIYVPPLRERKEDIIFLVKHFLKKFSMIHKKEISEISDEAMDLIMSFDWPGNIRQLENAIEYAVIRTNNHNQITASKLPSFIRTIPVTPVFENITTKYDSDKILELLNKYQWNKTKVAKELGVNRTTLWRKLKALNDNQN